MARDLLLKAAEAILLGVRLKSAEAEGVKNGRKALQMGLEDGINTSYIIYVAEVGAAL